MSYHSYESGLQSAGSVAWSSGDSKGQVPLAEAVEESPFDGDGTTDKIDVESVLRSGSSESTGAGLVTSARGDDLAKRSERRVGGRLDIGVDPLASTKPPGFGGVNRTAPLELSDLEAIDAVETGEDALNGQPTRIERLPDAIEDQVGGQPRLLVIGGTDRGKEFQLGRGERSIGRGLENDVVLADIAVSRRHTLVTHDGTGFVLTDLGSGNGTLVNGERVDSHLLRPGDQIELGNTLLRFISPGDPSAALGEAVTQVGEIAVSPVVGVAQGGAAQVTAIEQPIVVARPQTEPRRGSRSRSTKLLIFGGLVVVVLLGFAILVKVALDRRARQAVSRAGLPIVAQPSDPNAAASIHFDRGRKFIRERAWQAARDEFEKVYALAPRFDHAKRYVRQAKLELKAEQVLAEAKEALLNNDFERARARLADIPGTSMYSAEVPQLKQQIDDKQVGQLLGRARGEQERGHLEQARAAVAEALRIAPADERLQQLHEELGRGDAVEGTSATEERPRGGDGQASGRVATTERGSKTRSRAGRRAADARSRSGHRGERPRDRGRERVRPAAASRRALKAAMGLYERMDWAGAAAAVREQAGSLEGAPQDQLEAQAKAIEQVSKAYKAALSSQSRDPGQAIKHYQTAIKQDQLASGGVHRKEFEGRLFKVARLQAISSLSTGRYDAALAALKLARRYGEADAQLRRVEESLEKKALDLFTKGYTIRTRDADEARRLWQRVLRMVPPESTAYQKAYKWLNNSAPNYLDEDEF